jgi:predicted nucleic-acid-binding Zn-ribbon protein
MGDQENVRYQCPKCGSSKFRTGNFKAYEEDASSVFDVGSTKKFYTVSCARCGYTELYKARSNEEGHILDFLRNS